MPAWLLPAITAAAGLIGGKGGGEAASYSQQPRLTPQQSALLDAFIGDLRPRVSQGLTNLFDYSPANSTPYLEGYGALRQNLGAFDPAQFHSAFQSNVANPALREFREQIVPTVQQSFINNGGARSSAYNAGIAQQGSELAAKLAAQRQQGLFQAQNNYNANQVQAANQALNYAQLPGNYNISQGSVLAQLLNTGINPNFTQVTHNPGTQSALPGLFGAAGGYLGYQKGGSNGLEHALLGQQLGSSLGNLFR